MSGVTFADSSFLSALLGARNRAEERAGSVRLLAGSPSVDRPLEITGTAVLFPLVEAGSELI